MNAPRDEATRLIEWERAQIGHEIHDSLLPLIFAASASVGSLVERLEATPQAAANADTLDQLRQTADWLNAAMQTGRGLLTQVYPPELRGSSWSAAADSAVERLIGEESRRVCWSVDEEARAIVGPLAVTAYRVVIEAIRNAIRHGRAEQVRVTACASDGSSGWTVKIFDDGSGFDPQAVGDDRFGIRSMRARAALVGGRLTIDSRPGGPSIVTLELPAQPPTRSA